jgi:hypothetical protein
MYTVFLSCEREEALNRGFTVETAKVAKHAVIVHGEGF